MTVIYHSLTGNWILKGTDLNNLEITDFESLKGFGGLAYEFISFDELDSE